MDVTFVCPNCRQELEADGEDGSSCDTGKQDGRDEGDDVAQVGAVVSGLAKKSLEAGQGIHEDHDCPQVFGGLVAVQRSGRFHFT
jgi:hypothetical protein